MATTLGPGYGGHRGSDSISGESVLAALIPTVIAAALYLTVFTTIRSKNLKHYAPRTFLGTIPEKERTPSSSSSGKTWFHDFRRLSDRFVLQHNSLDAYLYLRFLRLIIFICFLGCCITWPILLPINATGGGRSSQLDKFSFGNIAENDRLWAHVVVSWLFFGTVLFLLIRERLHLLGARQAYLLDETRALRLSSRTVLFLNVPHDALQSENLSRYFGDEAEKCWPVKDAGDLDSLVEQRKGAAFSLESAQLDLIRATLKRNRKNREPQNGPTNDASGGEEGRPAVPKALKQALPFLRSINEQVEKARQSVLDTSETIDAHRKAPSRNLPGQSAIFVSFSSQGAAHRAFEKITFQEKLPLQDRYLGVVPKEVLWNNLALTVQQRLSKASLALVFVIAFMIFFSIPVGLIGSLSNVNTLAKRFDWLSWIKKLPTPVLSLLTGFVPPFLVSWFTSYVPKLFRHIAKLSGEPTTAQAELKAEAWFFTFSVFQIFLVTTFSSGAAGVAKSTIEDPLSTPALLAEALPTASNFYITYFILQGVASSADSVLNYSDLFEYWFYEYYWDKTPREKFQDYAQMKGMSWCSWYGKFGNLFVIAIAYSCIAPLVLGFATAGIYLYYLAYRYNILYTMQCKVDTRGEAYKRALQLMPTGVYLAQICLIGLMGLREAAPQTAVMVVLLVLTAIINGLLDRSLRPLELYLGLDTLEAAEVPLLAEEDGVSRDDPEDLHAASHIRRLGLTPLPKPLAYDISKFLDSVIGKARKEVKSWMHDPSARAIDDGDSPDMSEDELAKAYTAPAFTAKTPKLWIPKDKLGVSKQVIQENEEAGIPTTDDGAELDEKGRLSWDHDFDKVPIYSRPKQI